jgi:glycosyltransferase involved in cell wall biosynthesis
MLTRPEWRPRSTVEATDAIPLAIDTTRAGFVLGWAAGTDRVDGCDVLLDGVAVKSTVRSIPRPDLVESLGRPAIGFIVTFEASPDRRPRHAVLHVRAGEREGATPFECRKQDWRRSLVGRLERVNDRFVSGWLVDPGAVRARRRATLAVNDIPVCVVEASIDRPDVQSQFGTDGPTGLLAELPRGARPGDVVTLVDARGSEIDRLVVPLIGDDDDDDAPVTDPIRLPDALLERYRHDHNTDFLLIRGPGFRVQRRQRGRFAVDARPEPRRSLLTQQFDHIAMTRPPDERIHGWLDEVDRAVAEVGHRHRNGWLLMGEDDLARAQAADDEHVVRGRPALTAWQRARLVRTGHRPPVTDEELALFLTHLAVDLRSVGNGTSLLPDEQVEWLADLVDPWHPVPITRYLAARRSVVPHWRDAFAGDDALSRTGLLCEAFADEMCNGFGWTFFGPLAGMPEIVETLAAAVLVFCEGGWPDSPVVVGDSDVASFRRSVNPHHPLALQHERAVHHQLSESGSAGSSSAPAPAAPHHSLIGLIGHGSAVGHNAALSERALAALAMDGPIVSLDHSSSEVGTELVSAGEAPSSWVLLHSQPDYLPAIMANGWPYLGRAGTVIGYMAWESTAVPQSLHSGIRMVDEVWTPSAFSATGLRTATSRDVHVVPHAFLPEEAAALLGQDRAIDDAGPFTVLAIADAHSGLHRKNVTGTLAAFERAFGGDRSYRMVLRIRNFAHVTDLARQGNPEAHELLSRIAASRNVEIVSGEMTRAEVLELYAKAHCYLSLHRSEGFGYTMAEAMMAGVPVVATGYSGNLDYMDDSTALLVDFDETAIRPGEYLFWAPGMQWANPSVEHAAELLREVAADRAGSRARAERARTDVAERLSFERLVDRFRGLLDGR